ncbi:class I SAM-dependent methyltransferase [Sphingomonas sp. ID1715]|uniref:class I SAM-dependent methyltransferase n=1 Tax=Sphingomonas sp. ID1715 TaxID=1656898 RepID=UPI001488F2DC|nr:class I SAM-dependent methyltransferase [Sphingomonas sp. ID1715]NNM77666.1 class I SAM-dependent methyltransferase [Sphingomonas sp. ID1715]
MDSLEWSGRVGDLWAEEWRRTDRSFVPVDAVLVETAAARVTGLPSPRILDVGCGAGTTSFSLAARLRNARITGVDLSSGLIDVARSRANAVASCRFEQGDATRWAGARDFDLLVSRHGVMFFDDPVSAFTHLRSLARPGAGLVFSCFQSPAANRWVSGLAHLLPPLADPHAPGPFAFADETHVSTILKRAGWSGAEAQPLPFEYVAGSGEDPVADAIDYFRRIGPAARAIRDAEGAQRERLIAGLEALVREHLNGDRVVFPAAAWIWSATA